MSAHSILDAYFKVKKVEETLKTVESIYSYGKQVENKKKGDSNWDSLKQDTENSKIITKAGKGVRGALKIFKKGISTRAEWPKGNRLKYFEWLAESQPFYGPTSDEAKEDQFYFFVSENNYDLAVRALLTEYMARLKIIQKYKRVYIAHAKYAALIEKTFMRLAALPSVVPGTATQAEWFTIAQNANQHLGLCNECIGILAKLEKRHPKAVKAYKTYTKIDKASGPVFRKLITSDDPADFNKYRKVLKKLESTRRSLRY